MTDDDKQADVLDIEVADDPKPADNAVVIEKTDDAPPKKDDIDDSVEVLRTQLAQSEQARAAAELRANEAAQQAHQAQGRAQDSDLHLVTNAIDMVNQAQDTLTTNLADAMAAQDFDTASKIQAAISTNAAKLLQLEQGKQQLENAPKQEAPRPYVADPVEALASQVAAAGSPNSAQWIRSHPEYATNPVLNGDMIDAHNAAVRRGVKIDSPEYFKFVEDRLGFAGEAGATAGDPPAQRNSPPPSAPVSRSGTGNGQRPNRVTLTSEEREMAEMMGMTPEEYGRNKIALAKEGRMKLN